MSWIEPVSTMVTAASLAKDFIQCANTLKTRARRVSYRVKNGTAKIPVFGAGGVGKSTVARILLGKNPLDISLSYDESWSVESIEFKGDVPGYLLVAPGQIARANRHWPMILAQVANGKCFGVINVVSYGYHDFMLHSYTEHDLCQPGMSPRDFCQLYIDQRRKIEIDMLKRIIHGLSSLRKPLWFLTIVNKQDLWWNHHSAVRKHYAEGDYTKILDEFGASVGERNFQHEIVPVSFALGNWVTKNGELLAPTVSGYDQVIHLRYLYGMFEKLDKLVRQGRPK